MVLPRCKAISAPESSAVACDNRGIWHWVRSVFDRLYNGVWCRRDLRACVFLKIPRR